MYSLTEIFYLFFLQNYQYKTTKNLNTLQYIYNLVIYCFAESTNDVTDCNCFVVGISSLYPELVSWCGSGFPTSTLNSKYSTLMISFSSDDTDNNYRGFKIAYWAKTKSKSCLMDARLVWPPRFRIA